MPDVHLRLVLYKRIAAAIDDEALGELEAELIDRFGPLPAPIQNLLRITRLKMRATRLGLTRIDVGALGGLVDFGAEHAVEPARVLKLVQKDPKHYRLEGASRLRFTRKSQTDPERIATADAVLTTLTGP
jgi:transcription-repair coupling factor (superfamily II helicase)